MKKQLVSIWSIFIISIVLTWCGSKKIDINSEKAKSPELNKTEFKNLDVSEASIKENIFINTETTIEKEEQVTEKSNIIRENLIEKEEKEDFPETTLEENIVEQTPLFDEETKRKIEEDMAKKKINEEIFNKWDEVWIWEDLSKKTYLWSWEELKDYNNKNIWISLKYKWDKETEIKIINNTIVLKKNNKESGWFDKNSKDIIEIYQKSPKESLEESIKKMIIEKNLSINYDKCDFIIHERDWNKYLTISYNKKIDIDTNKCFTKNQWQKCIDTILEEANRKIIETCSEFEKWPYNNYFIYQPKNTSKKFLFIKHIEGFDAPPWDIDSIKLSD